jgi:hypothetical protein
MPKQDSESRGGKIDTIPRLVREEILSYVQAPLVTWLDKKEKGGVRFNCYGALEPVLHDNPRPFLGSL